MRRSTEVVIAVLLVLACGLFTRRIQSPAHDWGDDFACYIQQADAIVAGTAERYVETNGFAMRASHPVAGPAAAPWGFPLLLAPVRATGNLGLRPLKGVVLTTYLLFLVALWGGLQGRLSRTGRLAVTAFFAVNPVFIKFMDQIMSDMPFLLFSTAGVLLAARTTLEGRPRLRSMAGGVLTGLVITGAIIIRQNGVLVLAALGAAQGVLWFRRRREGARDESGRAARVALLLLPYAVVAAGLVLYRMLPSGGMPPLEDREVTLASVIDNAGYYAGLTRELFPGLPAPGVLAAGLFLLAGWGAFRGGWRGVPDGVFVLLTLGLLFALPFRQGLRYMFPVIPFVVAFAAGGAEDLLRRPGAWLRVRRWAAAGLLLGVLGTMTVASTRAAITGPVLQWGPQAPPCQELFSFIRENTEPDAIIIFFKPRLMRLMTGRLSLKMDDPARLGMANYMCYCKGLDHDQVRPAEAASLFTAGRMETLFQNDYFTLLRIRR